MLRHDMAAIAEIGGFCIHFALFVFYSELVELSTRNSTRYGQGRNVLRLSQRWWWQKTYLTLRPNFMRCPTLQLTRFVDQIYFTLTAF